ncbi:MAG: NAD-dependent epimerase/dehydratase family protein [Vicinamibacteraceae bacterium]
MRVVVIGGTGHLGTYLVPRLVQAGHEVTCVSRRQREPYQPHPAWARVAHVALDRAAEDANGSFGRRIADLRPEIIVDLICYTLESATHLVDSLRGAVRHFLHCGTIWVHGPSVRVPTTEAEPRRPLGDYGRRKAAIERYLLEQARANRFPVTLLHPGHLVGSGWVPINPAANFNLDVYSDLAAGRELRLPHLGMETLHHVHADDVAQAFLQGIDNRDAAVGESFHVVSAAALTLRGYAEHMAAWFDQEARLRFLPWDAWRRTASDADAEVTFNHISHSSHCSIEKARARLGYEPRYSSLEAVQEAVTWLIDNNLIRRD